MSSDKLCGKFPSRRPKVVWIRDRLEPYAMPLPCVVEMSDIRTKSVLMKKSNYNSEKFVRSFPFPVINAHSLGNDYSSRDTRLFGSEIVISVKAIISHLLPD